MNLTKRMTVIVFFFAFFVAAVAVVADSALPQESAQPTFDYQLIADHTFPITEVEEDNSYYKIRGNYFIRNYYKVRDSFSEVFRYEISDIEPQLIGRIDCKVKYIRGSFEKDEAIYHLKNGYSSETSCYENTDALYIWDIEDQISMPMPIEHELPIDYFYISSWGHVHETDDYVYFFQGAINHSQYANSYGLFLHYIDVSNGLANAQVVSYPNNMIGYLYDTKIVSASDSSIRLLGRLGHPGSDSYGVPSLRVISLEKPTSPEIVEYSDDLDWLGSYSYGRWYAHDQLVYVEWYEELPAGRYVHVVKTYEFPDAYSAEPIQIGRHVIDTVDSPSSSPHFTTFSYPYFYRHSAEGLKIHDATDYDAFSEVGVIPQIDGGNIHVEGNLIYQQVDNTLKIYLNAAPYTEKFYLPILE